MAMCHLKNIRRNLQNKILSGRDRASLNAVDGFLYCET